MTNKELILEITSTDREERLEKITSMIFRKFNLQERKVEDQFYTPSRLTNIILPAKDQDNKVTIMAHWDLYPESLGYNDNSSGVATILKLQAMNVPDNVEFVITDGEEIGGQGCRQYLEEHTHPKQAINIDVVGLAGKIFYEEYVKKTSFNIPSSFVSYPHIPFSDSYILEDYGIPNILMVTGKDKSCLIREIFESEHCGINDNKIEMIDESIMDEVFDQVLTMIK